MCEHYIAIPINYKKNCVQNCMTRFVTSNTRYQSNTISNYSRSTAFVTRIAPLFETLFIEQKLQLHNHFLSRQCKVIDRLICING